LNTETICGTVIVKVMKSVSRLVVVIGVVSVIVLILVDVTTTVFVALVPVLVVWNRIFVLVLRSMS
jgi:hypothetical protein